MTEEVDKKELNKQLAELVREAHAALEAAEDFADLHGLTFEFGPAYGMGGYYVGKNADGGFNEEGWNPSSMSC